MSADKNKTDLLTKIGETLTSLCDELFQSPKTSRLPEPLHPGLDKLLDPIRRFDPTRLVSKIDREWVLFFFYAVLFAVGLYAIGQITPYLINLDSVVLIPIGVSFLLILFVLAAVSIIKYMFLCPVFFQ